MKLIDLEIKKFMDEVDSKSPAPGGGSVSALAGSQGVALSRMVGHLTVGKKKFLALDEHIQKEFNETLSLLESKKHELLTLIDLDTEAFNLIMEAYKLPKNSDEDIVIRNQKIEEATKIAIDVPFKVARCAYHALELIWIIVEHGNKTALSDLGVSVLNLSSAIEGALMNVLINLPGLSNVTYKMQCQEQADLLLNQTHVLKNKYLTYIYQQLKP
jgi:formiminotetrahydrofolate cyclodeaminase